AEEQTEPSRRPCRSGLRAAPERLPAAEGHREAQRRGLEGRKKAGQTARPFGAKPVSGLRRLDVARLLALRCRRDFELDLLAFLQSLEPRHVDRREVREQVFAAAVRGDEAETLGVVKPLHCSSCHCCFSSRTKRFSGPKSRPMFRSQGKNGDDCRAVEQSVPSALKLKHLQQDTQEPAPAPALFARSAKEAWRLGQIRNAA